MPWPSINGKRIMSRQECIFIVRHRIVLLQTHKKEKKISLSKSAVNSVIN